MIPRRLNTPSVDLLYLSGSTTVPTSVTAIPFRFAAPGPRVMLTLKILARQFFDPGTTLPMGHLQPFGVPFDWTIAGTVRWKLWLARTVIDVAGAGQRIPVANLFGTRALPIQISDQDTIFSGLKVSTNGFSLDVTSGGDGVDGELTMDTDGFEPDPAIMVAIRGRYNAVQPLCDDEWKLLRGRVGGFPDAQRKSF